MMDHDNELARAKWLVGALALFVVTGFFSLNELSYVIWGKTVVAQVREAKLTMISQGRGRQAEKLSVAYSFPVEGGQPENATDLLPDDWPIPGNTIDVQYLPGKRIRSRVAGHKNMGAVYVFLASLAVLAGVIFKFYLEAKASERRQKRRFV